MQEFALANPSAIVLIALFAAVASVSVFNRIAWCYNRKKRSENIKAHGWPTNEYMDADGDLVYPNCTCPDNDDSREE